MSYGILVDVTRCTGCERCCQACVQANGKDPSAADRDRALVRDGLSANRPLAVLPAGRGRFARRSCLHCLEPSCAAACLVGAIEKTPEGAVVYQPDKCIGCRYCMLACPIHVPRYQWDKAVPYMVKCTMCIERLRAGEERPACVAACPNQALVFGERADLVARAHDLVRVASGRYLPRVWGEEEWGGTSVLYVSDVDLGSIGWPGGSAVPIPAITDPVIHKTPVLAGSVFLGLWALSAIVARRQRLMTPVASDASGSPETSGSPQAPEGETHD
jgi:formate dehydrogenase iron-sulfur subunit